MEEKQFKIIINKSNLIIRLLALNIVKDAKSQKEKILKLSSFGFGPTEIAALVGTTVNTANVTISRAKKEETQRKVERNDKQRDNEAPA